MGQLNPCGLDVRAVWYVKLVLISVTNATIAVRQVPVADAAKFVGGFVTRDTKLLAVTSTLGVIASCAARTKLRYQFWYAEAVPGQAQGGTATTVRAAISEAIKRRLIVGMKSINLRGNSIQKTEQESFQRKIDKCLRNLDG